MTNAMHTFAETSCTQAFEHLSAAIAEMREACDAAERAMRQETCPDKATRAVLRHLGRGFSQAGSSIEAAMSRNEDRHVALLAQRDAGS